MIIFINIDKIIFINTTVIDRNICYSWYNGNFAAGVIDYNGNFVSQDTPPVSLIPVVYLDLQISWKNLKRF